VSKRFGRLPFGLRRGDLAVDGNRTAVLWPCGHLAVLTGLSARSALRLVTTGYGRCSMCIFEADRERAMAAGHPRLLGLESPWRTH
jgi:hypothetical protein